MNLNTKCNIVTAAGFVTFDMILDGGKTEWTVDADFGDDYPPYVAAALALWYTAETGIKATVRAVESGHCQRCGESWDPLVPRHPHVCPESDPEARAFAVFADLHPHAAYALNPEGFWDLFHKRYPNATREQMEKLLAETAEGGEQTTEGTESTELEPKTDAGCPRVGITVHLSHPSPNVVAMRLEPFMDAFGCDEESHVIVNELFRLMEKMAVTLFDEAVARGAVMSPDGTLAGLTGEGGAHEG